MKIKSRINFENSSDNLDFTWSIHSIKSREICLQFVYEQPENLSQYYFEINLKDDVKDLI